MHQQNRSIAVVLMRASKCLSNVCRAPVLWASAGTLVLYPFLPRQICPEVADT